MKLCELFKVQAFANSYCEITGVSFADLCSQSRKQKIVDYRKAFIALAVKYFPKVSNTNIGNTINREHDMVNYYLKCAKDDRIVELLVSQIDYQIKKKYGTGGIDPVQNTSIIGRMIKVQIYNFKTQREMEEQKKINEKISEIFGIIRQVAPLTGSAVVNSSIAEIYRKGSEFQKEIESFFALPQVISPAKTPNHEA